MSIKREYVKLSQHLIDVLEWAPHSVIPIKSERCNPKNIELFARYLNHHKGKEPAEISKPIRSSQMEKICEDLWDA
eukprot:UN34511